MFFYGFIIGGLTGVFVARRHKGNLLDMLQYGAGFGMAFGIIAMIIGVIMARMSM